MYGKTFFRLVSFLFTILITSFSRWLSFSKESLYNYLFRFFLIRFSMSMLLSLKRKVTKETLNYFFVVYGRTTRFKLCLCTSVPRAFALVGPSGLEPPTSCLSGTRSNLLSYDPSWLVSGYSLGWWRWWDSVSRELRARSSAALTVRRTVIHFRSPSNPSSDVFELFLTLVEMMGFEPMTPCLQGRCSPSWATPP